MFPQKAISFTGMHDMTKLFRSAPAFPSKTPGAQLQVAPQKKDATKKVPALSS